MQKSAVLIIALVVIMSSLASTEAYALSFDDILTAISDFFGGNDYLITGQVTADPPDIYDIDLDGSVSSGTDGVLISRFLFGFTGTTLTNNALSKNAMRSEPNDIISYLRCLQTAGVLDADGNGDSDALTDGVLISRYIMDYTGTTLTDGAVGIGATRTKADDIINFLNNVDADCGGTTSTTSVTTSSVSTSTTTTINTTTTVGTTTILNITTTTKSPMPISLSYDADGNGNVDGLTDGVLIARYLMGFSGNTLTDQALAQDATRTTSNEIITYLDCLKALDVLDVDGNGQSDALTDGVLIARYMLGFTGDVLIDQAVSVDATRTTASEIITFMDNPSGWSSSACQQSNFQPSQVLADVNEVTGKVDQYYCDYDETRNKVAVIIKDGGIYDNPDITSILNQYFTSVNNHLGVSSAGIKKFSGATKDEFDDFIENLINNDYVGYAIVLGMDLPVTLINDVQEVGVGNYIILDMDNLNFNYRYVDRADNDCIDIALSFVFAPVDSNDNEKGDFIESVFTNFVNYHNNPNAYYNSLDYQNLVVRDPSLSVGIPSEYYTPYFFNPLFLSNWDHTQIESEMIEGNILLSYFVHGWYNNLGIGLKSGTGPTYSSPEEIMNFYDKNGQISMFVDILASCGADFLDYYFWYYDDKTDTWSQQRVGACCWPQTWLYSDVWATYEINGAPSHHNFERWACKERVIGNALRKTFHNQGMIYGDILAVLPECSEIDTATASSTKSPMPISLAYDADGDGNVDALTDGLLIARYLMGFSGNTLTDQAVSIDATRTTASAIISYLDCVKTMNVLDVDGNGQNDGLTDGVLIARYMLGFTGSTLIDQALAQDATRNTASDVIAFMDNAVDSCSGTTTISTTTTISSDKNEKNMNLYSNKELFLVSDKNWKDVLPFVSASVWTQQSDSAEGACQRGYGTPDDVCVYPFLIYHEEDDTASLQINENDFDITTYNTEVTVTKTLSAITLGNGDDLTLTITVENPTPDTQSVLLVALLNYPDLLDLVNPSSAVYSIINPFAPGETRNYEFNFTFSTVAVNSFDADSSIYFMQQYSPYRVTLIGDTLQELDDLLVAAPELGAGLTQSQVQRINPEDYLDYWDSYKEVVYVEDNYELALLASTYASLINAPLVVEGSANDNADVLSGRNLICVGSVSQTCDESYTLEELQQKYVDETQTDKIVLVNPNDLDIYVVEEFQPEKSANPIYEIYSKTSLAAPILASAKKEVLLSTTYTDYQNVDNFIENKIGGLEINAEYLTIIASPNAIQNSADLDKYYSSMNHVEDVDSYIYGSTDMDYFIELSIGRLYGITLSDISSYLSRDVFYNSMQKSYKFAMLFKSAEFPMQKSSAKGVDSILSEIGFDKYSVYTDDDNTELNPQRDLIDRFYINYLDHGAISGWHGIGTSDLNDIWLSNPIVVGDACLTCAYDSVNYLLTNKGTLFCTNMLRRGSLAYVGAVDVAGADDPSSNLLYNLLGFNDLGKAFKNFKNVGYPSRYNTYMLLGDPTFNPMFPSYNPGKMIITTYNINSGYLNVNISFPSRSNITSQNYISGVTINNVTVYEPLFVSNNRGSYAEYRITSFSSSSDINYQGSIYNTFKLGLNLSDIQISHNKDNYNISVSKSDVMYNSENYQKRFSKDDCYDSFSNESFRKCLNFVGSITGADGPYEIYRLRITFIEDYENDNYIYIRDINFQRNDYNSSIPAYTYDIKIPLSHNVHTCYDFTPYNQCAGYDGKYCNNNGELVNNCSICPCEIGICQPNGGCA